MSRPYIICHMMASLDGRIDCAMTAKLPGVDEYYQTLSALNVPTTLSGKVTAQMELTEEAAPLFDNDRPIGKAAFSKAQDAEGYSVVVDTKGTLGWAGNIVDDKPLIVITSEQAGKRYLSYLDERNISWIACGGKQIDLAKAVEILNKEFGVDRMGIVGGGSINAGFLDADLLDEGSMLYAPAIDGRGGMKAAFDSLPMDREPFILKLKEVRQYDNGCVWMRYTTKK